MSNFQFTNKAEKVLHAAHGTATDFGHTQLEPVHLASALLAPGDDGTIPLFTQIITKTGADTTAIERAIAKEIARLPSQDPAPEQVGMSQSALKILQSAQKTMKTQKDTYIAIDHLIVALVESPKIKTILTNAGASEKALLVAIEQSRGSKRVDSKNAEEGFEALSKYSTDLTQKSRDGELDPVIGRDDEIRRVIRILSRRTKSNPCLTGEPGVGKSAIAEGLANRITDGDCPANLKECRLLSLDIAALLAGASHRGEFEERLKAVMKEVEDSEIPIILFIDEIHLLIGAGSAGDSGMDAANILKPMLARGKLHCIGATTLQEYHKYIERDAAFERRFQQVLVKEPSVPDTVSILRGLKERYEVYHGITITDSALVSAATLAGRYLTSRRLPDSAIDLVDEAAAAVKVARDSLPEEVDVLERQISSKRIEIHALEREKDQASKDRLVMSRKELANLEEALAPLRTKFDSEKARGHELQDAKKKLDDLKNKAANYQRSNDYQQAADITYYAIPELEKHIKQLEDAKTRTDAMDTSEDKIIVDIVGEQEIADIVSRWTGINVSKLKMSEKEKLIKMEKQLAAHVVGQPEAVKAVSNAVRLSRAGLSDPNQPIASFLFCGPSGTGKTLLTKQLASFLFDDSKAIVRIDCSEYSESHSKSRLIGAPPGYVGYDSGGQLTEAIRRRPFSIVLFDEIEKAAPEVLTVLLQVLDEGRLTSGQGQLVDFKNTIIIATSNLGAQYLLDETAASSKGKISKLTRDAVMGSIRSFFKPEFLNRLSNIIIFNKLTPENIRAIVDQRILEVQQRLNKNGKNVFLQLSSEAKDYLGAAGYSPIYGARPLNRLIQKEILEKLAVMILRDQVREGETAHISVEDGRITIAANHLGEDGLIEDEDSDEDLEMSDAEELTTEDLE
ncbi:Heat shock protein 104 [Taphrina deformans PYCC 5710]|uniref:Heat shock protein 104 n=1 Tax=Taphrina deformans (strain PYCC 5710 / ATCC 11124 / CBS 356.35 / IMI 108563 / JCM 9778 / NBRC 8474) TaxID=1097556 RepID=R4XGY7_TAPDE|nr:Heat shock protein 104 [Taphrina deformans PYCC 5710]|eukprot:CCG82621.1 Heat shock protein 104 [Taphrina deformans PYCC 5710]